MFDDVCYRSNFLTNVIARVDFPSPMAALTDQLPQAISKAVMTVFPIAEPQKAVAQELRISPNELRQRRSELTEWHFHGRDRDKTLTIIPTAVFVEYTSYSNYETLTTEFLRVLRVFFDHFVDLVGSRLGLRYINNITLPDGDPLSWGDYLNERMLCLFHFYQQTRFVARVFHNIELNFGDFNLRYQFGMHNPDYPAPIKRRAFILDFDAYSQSPQAYGDIAANLDVFHSRIQESFEMSITDKLRDILNG